MTKCLKNTDNPGLNQVTKIKSPSLLCQCCCLSAVSVPANALYIIFNIDNGSRVAWEGRKIICTVKKLIF